MSFFDGKRRAPPIRRGPAPERSKEEYVIKNTLLFLLASLLLAVCLPACGGGHTTGIVDDYGTAGNGSVNDGNMAGSGSVNNGSTAGSGSVNNGSTAGKGSVNGSGSGSAGDGLMDDARNALDDAGNAIDRAF